MRDITHSMNNYRECSRNLWNTYFARDQATHGIDSIYEQVRSLLFEGLVTKPLNPGTDSTPTLLVAPMVSLPILIRRPSVDGNHYWDEAPDLRAESDGARLTYIDLYDFFQYPVKDFRFYRCRVVKFPRRSEYEGREALVDVVNAKVLYDEAQSNGAPTSTS